MKMRTIFLATLVAINSAQFAQADSPDEPMQAQASQAHKHHKHGRKKSKSTQPTNKTPMVKDTRAGEIDLPGVMKIQGADKRALDFSRARQIPFSNGQSRTEMMSVDHQNVIQLPFPDYTIHGTDTVDIKRRGNNSFVYFKSGVVTAKTAPTQLWIESNTNGSVAGLEVIPKHIPGQFIVYEDVSRADMKKSGGKSESYVGHVQDLMQQLAQHQQPNGYSMVDLSHAKLLKPIIVHGVVVTPEWQYSGAADDIFVYKINNPSNIRITLKDEEFEAVNEKADSFYPKPTLNPGEDTELFIIVGKDTKGAEQ